MDVNIISASGRKISGKVLSVKGGTMSFLVGNSRHTAEIPRGMQGNIVLREVQTPGGNPVYVSFDKSICEAFFPGSSALAVFLKSLKSAAGFLQSASAAFGVKRNENKPVLLKKMKNILLSKGYSPADISAFSRIFSPGKNIYEAVLTSAEFNLPEEKLESMTEGLFPEIGNFSTADLLSPGEFFYIDDDGVLREYDAFSKGAYYFAEFELSRTGKINLMSADFPEFCEIRLIAEKEQFCSVFTGLLTEISLSIQKKIEKPAFVGITNRKIFDSGIASMNNGSVFDGMA